jgi:hypothetical protein
MVLELLLAAFLPQAPTEPASKVEVKVTQEYLVPVCVNQSPVDAGDRRWLLAPGSYALAFTMRNTPREGVPAADAAPGIAVVRFTLEARHKYDVEVRAPAMTFAARVWKRGEWKPVVRDRTVDQIVSTEPEWRASGCGR